VVTGPHAPLHVRWTLSWREAPTSMRVWERAGTRFRLISQHSTSSAFSSSALSSRLQRPPVGGCGTMRALEVRPVATRPAIAGNWRRDHLGLRRVSRDGAGSDLRCSPGLPLLSGGRLMNHRRAASDSALHAVLSSPAPVGGVSTTPGCRTIWTSSLGVVKGARSCPTVLFSEVEPSPVLPRVQGRAPGDCADCRWTPVNRSPAGMPAASRE